MKAQSKVQTVTASFSFLRGILSCGLVLLTLAACSGLQTRQPAPTQPTTPGQPGVRATPAPAQPVAPPLSPPPAVTTVPPFGTPAVPPTFLNKELPKVGVILGPGGMKTFAHLGVLREMQRARIPVHSMVGLEWGAVMGGLYSVQAQVNEAEWKAFKLRNEDLPGQGFLSSRIKPVSIATMQGFFSDVFGASAIERAKVPFACPTYSASSKNERMFWQERGSYREAMSRCVPYPPMYVDNGGFYASPFAIDDAAAWLRAKGANVIVLVNVLGQGENFAQNMVPEHYVENLLWSEVRREMARAKSPNVSWVINVNTSGHPITSSEGRRALLDAGSKAATDVVNKMVSQYGF